MSTKQNLSDPDVDDARDAEQARIEAAVAPPKPSKEKPNDIDAAKHAARDAELARQQAVVDAVAGVGDELAALGGSLLEPGLGTREAAKG
jgi:uncharacterized membrane protein